MTLTGTVRRVRHGPWRTPPRTQATLGASAAIFRGRRSVVPVSWASKRRAAWWGGRARVRWRRRASSVVPGAAAKPKRARVACVRTGGHGVWARESGGDQGVIAWESEVSVSSLAQATPVPVRKTGTAPAGS